MICGHDVQDAPRLAKIEFGLRTRRRTLLFRDDDPRISRLHRGIRGYRGAEIGKRIGAAVEKPASSPSLIRPSKPSPKVTSAGSALPRRYSMIRRFLVMDEPTDASTPPEAPRPRTDQSDGRRKAIIISTHILEEVEAICTRAVVINRGTIVADGTAEDLLHRIRHHGAVSIRVPTERSDAAIRILKEAKDIAASKTLGKANGHIHIRALPRGGALETADVAAVLRAQQIPIDELYVERGRLDDVFRQITTSDDQKRKTSGEGAANA